MVAQLSLAHQAIKLHSRMRRWLSRWSLKIRTCLIRFGPFAMRLQKSEPRQCGSLRAAVENEAQKLLPHGKAKRQRVAKTLGHSERTLARRLADENTTYEEVVDQLRRSLALQYVKEPSLSVSQIAWLLGYEGSSLVQPRFRALDRPFAIHHARRGANSRARINLIPAQPAAQASQGRRLAYVIRSGRPFAPILGLQPSGCAGAVGQFEHRTGQSGSSSDWRGSCPARWAID